MRPPAANPTNLLDWPLTFEQVEDWEGSTARFVFRGHEYTFFLETMASVLLLVARQKDVVDAEDSAAHEGQSLALRMTLVGANRKAEPEGVGRGRAKVHHLVGDVPDAWKTDVPTFDRVIYSQVYPGIDWIVHGDARHPKFDFDLAPGADARTIVIEFEGAESIAIDDDGRLRVQTPSGVFLKDRPLLYQENEGCREEVEGSYTLLDGSRVGFRVGEYDHSRRLVIDPALVYSTFVGGLGTHSLAGVAVDPQGFAVVVGRSQVFGTTPPHLQDSRILVAKFNPMGNLVYLTFLGGRTSVKPLPSITPPLQQAGMCVAVDADGNAYVGGSTNAKDFPLVNQIQTTNAGTTGFVFKLDPEGRTLLFSTYLGGATGLVGIAGPVLLQAVMAIAVDPARNVYVTGMTNTTDFPVTLGVVQRASKGKAGSVFVSKLSPLGNTFLYSTYLGGKESAVGSAVAVDADGNAYVAGQASSTDFPTAHAFQPAMKGSFDAFLTKLSPAGDALIFSTFLGGTNAQEATGIAIDSQRNVYITGWTASNDFPTVNAFQTFPGTDDYPFVSKFSADGSALVYSTRLGEGIGKQIAVDAGGFAYVSGRANQSSFPIVNPFQPPKPAMTIFVVKLSPNGSSLVWSSYIGECANDVNQAVAVGTDGRVYIAGTLTSSTDYTLLHAAQPINAADLGESCAYLAVIGEPGVLGFSADTYSAAATDLSSHVIVNRLGGTALPVSVGYAVSAGTATAGIDFISATGTLNFAVGQASAGFDVVLLGNPNSATDRSMNLKLSTPTGGATIGPVTSAVLTIHAAPSVVQFRDSSTSVQFDVGNTTVTVVRTGNLAGTATADWKTAAMAAPGAVAAVPGVDYSELSGTVTFGPGQSEQDVAVMILTGGMIGDRQFSVILKSAAGAAILGTNTKTIVAISHPS